MPRSPIVLAVLLAVALTAPAAPAAAGDYTVRLTSTSGSHWSSYGRGPFVAVPKQVHSGVGAFTAGDYRSWRVVVPGEGSRIVGGRIVATIATPNAAMAGRILVGTGNTPVVLYDGAGTGTVARDVTSGAHDWMQFDIRSTGATTTSRVAENTMTLASAELVLRDSVPPVIAPIALPAPTAWHRADACIGFSIRLTDQGGGLLRSQVRRAADGVVVSELAAVQVESPKPGPNEQHLNDCIQPHERGHGDTAFIATVWDVGGTSRELGFTVRADQRPPAISGGPSDGERFTTRTPAIAFGVGDDGAGLASASATIDGAAVPVAVNGDTARLAVGELSIGTHTVALSLADGAGNGTSVQRRIVVADTTAPTLTLDSPGARGDSVAWLSVRAVDDMAGIDPTTWVATLNGEPVRVDADASHLTASIGPLAPGMQRIDVRVADRSGNVSTLTHAYSVVSAPVPSMPEVGARTGGFLVDGPKATVTWGTQQTVAIYVARNGRPLGGQLVELRQGDAVFGSSTSDEHGVARVTFRVGAPGTYRAWVVGMAMDPVDVPLRVAPRLVITTSATKPRVGQRVVIRGRIEPAIRGRRVAVEARIGGVWYPIRRAASTGADGRFASSVVATTKGTVFVRVRLLAVASWAPAISNQRALTVQPALRRPVSRR
ncbi:MAG: putative hemagglutinin/hemolysin/adhesin-related protein [Thermoleophilia bacterium]|nr:putative hemagglutinin/hemolysin/adhesin-related protein [Thermoleophilia bacterium]